MEPRIQKTQFGSITVGEETFEHDIVIRLDGKVRKRKKKLSKQHFGTSHTVSLEEAKQIHDDKAERLILGSGQNGMVRLSEEAERYFRKKGCEVDLLPTPEAVRAWNEAEGQVIGMFHVTC